MPFTSPSPSPSLLPKLDPGLLAHIWDKPPAQVAAIVVVLAAVGGLITAILPVWNVAKFLAVALCRSFRRPDADERYRIVQRQLFARHVVGRLQDLASKEDWRDDRFAELEAEVEVEGRERIIKWLRFSPYRDVALRRVKSLSKGLASTADDLVILEGDPGSGKSVALRHLAEELAHKAQKTKSSTALIPLYVNLKEFHPSSHPVSSDAVREFIIESLTRTHDRDVDQFIDEEFDRGMRDGTWLLLLDSFDEIPDVLSSTEGDSVIAEYADAINDFLSGMRTSRAIIASREFRGPVNFRVPRFRIMALTARQQADLIKRCGLKPPVQATVHEGLAVADPDLRELARNPMFLGLVCEYVRNTSAFPPSSHAAFDTYLEQRLTRDADRIRQRYEVGPDLVRAVAEEIAFCMTATEGLGLSPARSELRAAFATDGRISVRTLDKILDALEYTKLGRSAEDPGGIGRPHFTFAHRRFQEYFATRVVLRMPDRVPIPDLFANGRWRETAVTILQTQPPAAVAPLLDEAARRLESMETMAADGLPENPDSIGFPWPPGALHLLQLLDAGLGRAPDGLGPDLRDGCGRLLRKAWEHGHPHDRKWAVSAALVADPATTISLLERAFESGSVYLGDSAYAVVSRMASPPEHLYKGVRQTLLHISGTGGLSAEHITLRAQISRLPQPSSLLRVLALLTAARKIDLGLALLVVVALSPFGLVPWAFAFVPIALALPGFPFRYLPRRYSDRRVFSLFMLAFRVEAPILCAVMVALPSFDAMWTASADYSIHPTAVAKAAYFQNQEALIATMSSWQMIVGFAVAVYFASWPFVIAYCCERGCVPQVMAWPTMPFIIIARATADLLHYIASGFHGRWLRRIPWWHVLLFLAACLLIAGAAFLIVVTGFTHWAQEEAQTSKSFRRFSAVLGLILVSGFIMAAIVSVIIESHAWYKDVALVRRLAISGSSLESRDMLKLLGSVKRARGAKNALSVLCKIDLNRSPGTLRILSDLAFLMQHEKMKLKNGKVDCVPATGIGAEVRAWLMGANRKGIEVILKCDQRTQDMIARTVEQAELTRQEVLARQASR